MENVDYTVTLKDDDGGAVIPDHQIMLVRSNENGRETEAETLFDWTDLHPRGDATGYKFSVPRLPSERDWRYVLALRGPANPECPGIVNYRTEIVLPRQIGGPINFVMPKLATYNDLFDGKTACTDDSSPHEPMLEAPADPGSGQDPLSDFGKRILLGPSLVNVTVTDAQGTHANETFSAQLSIHGAGAMWTKCLPLDNATAGRDFHARQTGASVWVTLRKTAGGSVYSNVRLSRPSDGPAYVVFVVPKRDD